jgi:hypothetical protein
LPRRALGRHGTWEGIPQRQQQQQQNVTSTK